MKLYKFLAVTALIANLSIDEVAAVTRHHHHHHMPHLVQVNKVDDIQTKDPKFAELQKKKVEIQNAIKDETEDKPLTEEEEKEKFDKELGALEKKGEKVKAEAQIKDAEKSLAKLKEEEKVSGEPQTQKKAELEKIIPALKEKVADIEVDSTKVEAEPKKEATEKVKDLQKSLNDVEVKQKKEENVLEKVKDTITKIVDGPKEAKKPVEDVHDEEAPKPDLSPFKKNLAKIEKEEEEKEAIIEARKAAQEAYPKNPAVLAAEEAQEAAEEAKQRAEEEAKAAEEEAARQAAAKKAAHKAASEARDAKIKGSAELWTANMPQEYLEGYIGLKMNQLRFQLAQLDNAEDSESDSDSD